MADGRWPMANTLLDVPRTDTDQQVRQAEEVFLEALNPQS